MLCDHTELLLAADAGVCCLAGSHNCNFHVLGQALSYFRAAQGSGVFHKTKTVLRFEHLYDYCKIIVRLPMNPRLRGKVPFGSCLRPSSQIKHVISLFAIYGNMTSS